MAGSRDKVEKRGQARSGRWGDLLWGAAPTSIRSTLVERRWGEIQKTFENRLKQGKARLNRTMQNGKAPDEIRLKGAWIKLIENCAPDRGMLTTDIIVRAELELTAFAAKEGGVVNGREAVEQWFRIEVVFFLEEDGVPVEYIGDGVYNHRKREKNRMDSHMIPYLNSRRWEAEAEAIMREYTPELLAEPRQINGLWLAERMGLNVREERLSHDNSILGMLYTYSGSVYVYDEERGGYIEKEIAANTILIDVTAIGETPGATVSGAVIHECVHYKKHWWYQWLQHNEDPSAKPIICPANASGAWPDELEPLWRMEMQARNIGHCIQLPQRTVRMKTEELLQRMRLGGWAREHRAYLLREIIDELAAFFGVPKQRMRRRLVDLGYIDAQGVLNYANKQYTPVYIAKPGTCTKHETYTLDTPDAIRAYSKNESLRELLATGRFIYIDGHFCLNDEKYIYRIGRNAYMKRYAREHIDECCLKFEIRRKVRRSAVWRGGVLHCDTFQLERCMTLASTDARAFGEAAARMRQEAERISKILRNLPAFFSDTLAAHMERLGVTNEALAERMGIGSRKVTDLRTQETPRINKRMFITLCVALHLEPELSEDLMRKAGIALGGGKEDVMFSIMLKTMYTYTVAECNNLLANAGIKPLSRERAQDGMLKEAYSW